LGRLCRRKAESRARGRLRGRGVSDYLELTGPPGREMGGIRFEPGDTITIVTGTLDYGEGHASPFAQALSARLGIPFRKIRLLQGDSDALIAGGGTGGSKSIMMSGGAATVEASDKVIEKGREMASYVLGAASTRITAYRARMMRRSLATPYIRCRARPTRSAPKAAVRPVASAHCHR
jgi:aerobic carbon-monoxide dehydrogenase large subunit